MVTWMIFGIYNYQSKRDIVPDLALFIDSGHPLFFANSKYSTALNKLDILYSNSSGVKGMTQHEDNHM